jgi:hypothetical protein
MLTVGRIQCAFTLPLVRDRVPLTLQVLGLEIIPDGSLTPVRVQITLSDGMHCGSMTLARRLHSLATKVRCGAIMRLNNYISQVVKDNIVGLFVLMQLLLVKPKSLLANPLILYCCRTSLNLPLPSLDPQLMVFAVIAK